MSKSKHDVKEKLSEKQCIIKYCLHIQSDFMAAARFIAALITLLIAALVVSTIITTGQKPIQNTTSPNSTTVPATTFTTSASASTPPTASTAPPAPNTTSIYPNATNASNSTFPYRFGWIISSSAVNKILAINATIAKWAFDNQNTIIIGAVPNGWTSKRVADFRNFSALNESINSLNPSEYYGVLLDQENWSFTPLYEQRNAIYYTMLASDLAKEHGLILISTPAGDLVKAYGYYSNFSEEFERMGIAYNSSKYSQIYEAQAQSMERGLSGFDSFSYIESLQAKSANPDIKFFIGLSTNPNAQNITGAELYAAINSTKNFSSGYWLNVPNQSASCEKCGLAKPQVAVQLLQLLYQRSR